MNHYLMRQTKGKRFLSGLFDVLSILLVGLIVFVPAQYIAEQNGLIETKAKLGFISLASGLFTTDDDGYLTQVTEEGYPEALYTFYVDIYDSESETFMRGYSPLFDENAEFNTVDDYYDHILLRGNPDTLFDFDNIGEEPYDVPAKSGRETEVITFYAEQMETAYDLLDSHKTVIELVAKYQYFIFLIYISTYLISGFIVIVLFPMLFKNSQSIGKAMTKTIILNGLGFKINFFQGLIRNVAIYIFSVVFFFLPFHIVSYLMSYFGKNNQSLYDRLAVTMVCDKNVSLVFDNAYEEAIYRKDLAQKLIEVDRRKAQARREEENRDAINL